MTESRTLQAGKPMTEERWIALARKALHEGVEIRTLDGGIVIATSGSDATRAYLLSPIEHGGEVRCACAANATWGRICKHISLWRVVIGELVLPVETEEGIVNE